MDNWTYIKLVQLVMSYQDRFRTQAEYYTYQISHSRQIPSYLFIEYYTALIKADLFDSFAKDVYNILKDW